MSLIFKHWLLRDLIGWRCQWCYFGGGGKWKTGEVEKEERDRQTKWLYWLVPPSSVDWDKFKMVEEPTEADASPDQPPSPPLSASLIIIPPSLPLSFSGALCSRSGRSDLTYQLPAAGDVCFFVFAAVTVVHHFLGGLRCSRQIIIDEHIGFLFPQKNTFLWKSWFLPD